MEYNVVLTADAEEDLDRFVRYLLFVKQNPQAATNVLNDFEETKQSLSHIAGSLQQIFFTAEFHNGSSEKKFSLSEKKGFFV